MALLITQRAFKQLAAMPKADARRLLNRLEKIADAPEKPNPNVAPLVREPGVFRVRQGNWRAVFSIEEGDVIVDPVAHRREVYGLNVVKILSETQDTVTVSRGDWTQLLSELEDAQDHAAVVERRRHEATTGKEAASRN